MHPRAVLEEIGRDEHFVLLLPPTRVLFLSYGRKNGDYGLSGAEGFGNAVASEQAGSAVGHVKHH